MLIFKILVLQQLNNLSDDRIEYQIRERLSIMRFLGLNLEGRVPDAKTVWAFRELLNERELGQVLFKRFDEQLAARGLIAKGGQMIDATFVEVPKSRNSREDNAKLKAGEIPEEWEKADAATKHMHCRKDTDARWAKKNNETHFGYKNHINADAGNKLIRAFAVTTASVYDSQVIDELLDRTQEEDGDKRAAYADSAYRSKEQEERLEADGIETISAEKGRTATRSQKSKKPLITRSPKHARGPSTWCAPSERRAPASRLR